jgi:hypothetical protein
MDSSQVVNESLREGQNIPSKSSSNSIREEKLLSNYNKLKVKYEQKVRENKVLKQTLVSTIEAVKAFEETYKSIQAIYSQCKDWMAQYKMPSNNNEFSTSDLSQFNQKTNNKNPEIAVMTNNTSSHTALLKKIEDFEVHYSEMSKNFNNLVVKYKIMKEEKNKIEDSSLKLLSRYSQLEKQYEETIRELYSKYDEIKRFEEIDKCLLEYTLNSFMLKVETKDGHNKPSLNNPIEPGIKCEPLPTFAKFLAFKK